jgi:tRNA nucleotidyltransferase/poly(A) polymerase
MGVPPSKRKILRGRACSAVFGMCPDAYLVGGYLRDLSRRGGRSKDIDFVYAGDFHGLAVSVAGELGGKVVELKAEQLTRVVLADGSTIDFSLMEGDILKDLGGRDFTMNAMAWSPGSGLLDPFGGLGDIDGRLVRALSSDNMRADTVRLLRAYRFSAELGFAIEGRTRSIGKALAGGLGKAASERITLEFFKLLNSGAPREALGMSLADGLLGAIIPLSFNKLRANIKSFSNIERNIKKLHEIFYMREFSQGLSVRGLLRLERLMIGSRQLPERLSLSNDIAGRLQVSGRLYGAFSEIDMSDSRGLFELFYETGDASLDLLVVSGRMELLGELKRFQRIQKKPLVKTEEVMELTGVGSGPELGRILKDLSKLRFSREIRGRRDAARWLSAQ